MNTRKISAFSVLCLCLFFQVKSQTKLTDSINIQQKLFLQNGEVLSFDDWFLTNEPNSNSADDSSVGSYIVEFKEKPFFIEKKNNGGSPKSEAKYKNGINTFKSDLKKIGNQRKENPSLKRSFYKTFYGGEVSITKKGANELKKLPYVKQVYSNGEVKAVLDKSVPVIMADAVWNNLGSKGEGISIGIIDTGIDYMHSALGGGIGDSFKVKGGYDFVNDDADPMDDNGHGTHCAGIAAGDGTEMLGVAPEASLYALKVLGASGSGSFADVVAAIEWASDPNSDGDYADHLGVLSLSLGGPGDPGDPQSVAVDNAVDLGIVVCVATGNSGSYNTIGSPGTAERAVTVGASDNTGAIASFSSKGPNKKSATIKPEVVAPGVNINSAVPGGGFGTKSGTSMATPHVAGAAALLKVLHPDWTPEQFKSALMVSATDLGYDPMAQGAGLINVFKAATSTSHLYPAALSFGQASMVNATITKVDTIRISNSDTISRSYTIEMGDLPNGFNLSASSSTFNVAPGTDSEVVFQLDVDVALMPGPGPSGSYTGKVRFYSSEDTLNLPWAIAPRRNLFLKFDMPYPSLVYVTGEKSSMTHRNGIYHNDGYLLEFAPVDDTVDVVMIDLPYRVFKERVAVNEDTISLLTSDAVHQVTLSPKDINGQILTDRDQDWIIDFPENSNLRRAVLAGLNTSIYNEHYFSDVSSRFRIFANEMQIDISEPGAIYGIQYPKLKGIYSSQEVVIEPEDYIHQHIKLHAPQDTIYAFGTIFRHIYGNSSVGVGKSRGYIENGDWTGNLYLTEPPEGIITSGIVLKVSSLDDSKAVIETPNLVRLEDKIFASQLPVQPPSKDLYLSPSGGTLTFGEGLIFPEPSHYAKWQVLFQGKFKDRRLQESLNSSFKVFDESGVLTNSGKMADFNSSDLELGYNKLEVVNNSYSVAGVQGKGTYTATINTTVTNLAVAGLTSFQVRNHEGIPADTLELGEPVSIRYSVSFGQQHSIFARHATDTTWIKLETTKIAEHEAGVMNGNLYEATLRGLGKEGPADLKIVMRNSLDHEVAWQLEPALILKDRSKPELSVMWNESLQEDYSTIDFGDVVYGSSSGPIRITLTNSGADPLVFHNLNLSDTINFALNQESVPDTLHVGDTTYLTASLTPAKTGVFQDTLSIFSNHRSPFRIVVQGAGISSEMLVKHDSTSIYHEAFFDFGDVIPGQKDVYIYNAGEADLIFTGDPKVELHGRDSLILSVDVSLLADTIPPGGSDHFSIHFPGDYSGSVAGSLAIPNNDEDQNPYTFDFVANIVTADINIQHDGADLVNNGTTIDFGDVYVGDSLIKTFTIQNLGETDLGFYSTPKMIIQGENSGDFAVDFSQVSSSIAPGSSADFTVTYKPTAVRASAAEVYIEVSHDVDEPNFRFNVTGNGAVVSPEMLVKFSHAPVYHETLVDFGDLTAGRKYVYIHNTGEADLIFTSDPKIELYGRDSSILSVDASPLADTIPPGGSDNFFIRFPKEHLGSVSASLAIANNDEDQNPYTFDFVANIVTADVNIQYNGSDLVNDETTIDFGDVYVGDSLIKTFTVQNIGEADLGFYTTPKMRIQGGNTADFKVDYSQFPSSIAPGGSANFTVTFKPTAADYRASQVYMTVYYDHDEPNFKFNISGQGKVISPEMQFIVSVTDVANGGTYDFGDVPIGSPIKWLRTYNYGDADLMLTGTPKVTFSGPDAEDFEVSGTFADTIAPGSYSTEMLRFLADSPGPREATLTIPNNDAGDDPYQVHIRANMVSGDINVQYLGVDLINDSSTVDFGTVATGDTSEVHTFVIENLGDGPLKFNPSGSKIWLQGTDYKHFAVDYSALPTFLNPGETTTFTIAYLPTSEGFKSASARIPVFYDWDESSFTIHLTGGVMEEPHPEMQFIVSVTDVANGGTYDLGDVPIGSPIEWLRTYNYGDADLVLTGTPKVTFSGPDAADFGVSGTFADTIAPGSYSTEMLRFLAKTPGLREATLTIPNNDAGDDPYQVNIRANMVSGDINVQYLGSDLENGKDQVDFGAVEPGQSSQPQTFVIENLGDGPLKFSSGTKVYVFGTDKEEFSVDYSQMSYYLHPGDTTTFSITFSPSSVGQRSAYAYIPVQQDWDESNFQFDLTGGVMEEPHPEMQFKVSITDVANGGTYDFGDVPIGSPIKWLHTYNYGDADLVLTGTPKVTFSGPDSADFKVSGTFADTIAPGTNSTERLWFLAKTPGIKEATLTVPNNDADNDPYQVNIRANMVSGDINVKYLGVDLTNDSSTVDFGTVATGDTSEVHTFVIENLGEGPLKFNGGSKIWLQGTDYTHFAVDYSALPTFLYPGETTTFTIAFLPTSEGVKGASARIPVFYDWDERYFTIHLTGHAGSTGARLASSSEQPKEPNLEVTYYPNPFEQTISIYADYDATVTVQSLNGAEVDSFHIKAHELLNYGDDLPSGVYLFRLIRDNKTHRIIKVVKQ